ncbi:MAG TPA: GNAT family N-acetyltransferase [Thermoanaerobaculia bacterium]|nr:GNAT family N-acetyltransferase [Thermoanaerobaculia bacterium]
MGSLAIDPLADPADIVACARMMASSDPWRTLGRGVDACARALGDETRERWVARADGAIAGFLILNFNGPFVGYIQAIFAADGMRGRGIGTALLAFAEERIHRVSPNVFLCVTSFNEGAKRLYERSGYEVVGVLRDYLVRGYDEILMRKTIGPIDEYAKR